MRSGIANSSTRATAAVVRLPDVSYGKTKHGTDHAAGQRAHEGSHEEIK
jgi:hypothetical protein